MLNQRAGDGKIQLAGQQHFCGLVCVHVAELRHRLVKMIQDAGQVKGCKKIMTAGKTDIDEMVGQRAAEQLRLVGQRIVIHLKLFKVGEQKLCLPAQDQLFFVAVKQRDAQLLLQAGDGKAEGWL